MAPVVYNSDAINAALALPQEERRRLVTKIAAQQGAIAAAQASLGWVPVVTYLLNAKSEPALWFQTRLNTSAKTAATIMPIIFAFGMVSEQVATRLANPQAFVSDVSTGRVSALPVHKRLANFVYDHPINSLIMAGVPAVLTIFMSKSGQTELSLSQRIMHTRVAGQFTVLMTLVSVMGFHDYMGRRGRFLEPWEEELRQKQMNAAGTTADAQSNATH
jgi:hypothetical protein